MIPINPVTVGIFAAILATIFWKGGVKRDDAKRGKNGRDRPDRNSSNGTATNGSGVHGAGRVTSIKGGAKGGNLHKNEPDASASGLRDDLRGEPNRTRSDSETTGLATVKEVDEL